MNKIELLRKIKDKLISRHIYFSELYTKNLSLKNLENKLFDLGEMDCCRCMLDYIDEIIKEIKEEK